MFIKKKQYMNMTGLSINFSEYFTLTTTLNKYLKVWRVEGRIEASNVIADREILPLEGNEQEGPMRPLDENELLAMTAQAADGIETCEVNNTGGIKYSLTLFIYNMFWI